MSTRRASRRFQPNLFVLSSRIAPSGGLDPLMPDTTACPTVPVDPTMPVTTVTSTAVTVVAVTVTPAVTV
jgi:hypothetical protein